MRLHLSWQQDLAPPGTFCLQVTFKCRGFVALPQTPGSFEASHLICALLVFFRWIFLLSPDLKTFCSLHPYKGVVFSAATRFADVFSMLHLCLGFVPPRLKQLLERKLGTLSSWVPPAVNGPEEGRKNDTQTLWRSASGKYHGYKIQPGSVRCVGICMNANGHKKCNAEKKAGFH